MEDSTPGSTEDQNLGVQETSLDTTQQQSADTGSDTTSTTDATQGATEDTPQVTQDSTDDISHESQEDEVADWAKKQGYDLDNLTAEQAKTLAKRVIDNQKAYHEANSRLKAAEQVSQGVSDTLDDTSEDPLNVEMHKELAAVRTERFFNKTPEAEQYAEKMVEILQQERENYGDDAARMLANNLPRLLTLAKADSLGAETSTSYEQGRQDERQNLAKSQQAGAPASNAVNSAPQSQAITDKQIGDMSTAEYLEWRKTHNPWDVAA